MKKVFLLQRFIQQSFRLPLHLGGHVSVVGAILLIISYSSFAQNPLVKQWDYRFGGTSWEQFSCFQQTADGGYILGGHSGSGIGADKTQSTWGGYDYWIVKLDSLGNKQWDKDFGGLNDDWFHSLQQTADGGYILGGYSYSGIGGDKTQANWGVTDYWIVKTDSLGNIQWDRDFGGTSEDELHSLQQTSDGGYILGGHSASGIGGDKTQPVWIEGLDYWIVKIDSIGTKQWDKDLGGLSGDYLNSVQQTDDGGYILGGYSGSGVGGDKTQPNWGDGDYWIVKTDSFGNMQWDKDFGGTRVERCFSLTQTVDGGYILFGNSLSGISGDKTQGIWGGIDEDYWIVKIDSLGIKQWDKDFGGISWENPYGNISQTSDKGYLIAGPSSSPIGGDKTEQNLGARQTWIVKTDLLGNKQWDKTIFTNGIDDFAWAIQTRDGCYVIANPSGGEIGGYKTQSGQGGGNDYWIVKFCDTTSVFPFITSDSKLCEKFCTSFYDQSTNNPTAWQWNFPGGDPSSSQEQNPANICYNNPGVYDVALITTNAFGNDTLTLANYITVNPTPPIPSIDQNGNTLTSSLASSYQWQFNSVDISGATNQSYIALQSGLYTVVVGDSNSCKNSFTLYVLLSGVDDVMSDGNISILPNPSNGNFTVEFTRLTAGSGLTDEVSIEVVNTVGQIIFSSKESRSVGSSPFKKEIDLRSFASGIYIVEIKTKDVLLRKKIVIEE